jgi:hypothetical protein
MIENRAGRLSDEDKKFIRKNAETMNHEDISRHLARNPRTIKRYIEKTLGLSTMISPKFEDRAVEYSIKKSIVWKELTGQFTKEELDKFLYHWRRIITQFGGDTLATEEMQVVDYIKMDLLMDRILTSQQDNLKDISDLEKKIMQEKAKTTPDDYKVQNWLDQISFRRASQEDVVKQYQNLLKEKQALLKGMKATRDARITHLKDSNENIPDWIRQIVTNDNKRKELGLYMEKMRLAMKAEETRLSELYVYSDGIVQPPIMTSETMKKINTDEREKEKE